MAANVLKRKVMRFVQEASYINTVNVADRLHIDFVWYPGEATLGGSLVDPMVAAADGRERSRSRWHPVALVTLLFSTPVGRSLGLRPGLQLIQ